MRVCVCACVHSLNLDRNCKDTQIDGLTAEGRNMSWETSPACLLLVSIRKCIHYLWQFFFSPGAALMRGEGMD